jgi:Cleft lip and palate transmembrane protein 1 (CLPTM1)
MGMLRVCWAGAGVTRYLPRPKRREGVNLLSGAEAEQHALAAKSGSEPGAPAEPEEIISFLLPNITFAMVDDFTAYPPNGVPPHVSCPHPSPLFGTGNARRRGAARSEVVGGGASNW